MRCTNGRQMGQTKILSADMLALTVSDVPTSADGFCVGRQKNSTKTVRGQSIDINELIDKAATVTQIYRVHMRPNKQLLCLFVDPICRPTNRIHK